MTTPRPGQGLSASFPILVPSENESRMVGCSCESDYKEVVWFELKKSEGVQRCECGYHFRLIAHDPLDKAVQPVYGAGYGSGYATHD